VADLTVKPVALLLIGMPGSGKSTYRASLPDFYVQASSDDYIDYIALRNGLTYSDVFKDFIKDAEGHFNSCIDYAVDLRVNVVVDRTNLSPKSRKKTIDKLRNTHYIKAVVFEISGEDLEINLNSRPGKNIPLDVQKRMRYSYEYPQESEGINEIEVIRFNRKG